MSTHKTASIVFLLLTLLIALLLAGLSSPRLPAGPPLPAGPASPVAACSCGKCPYNKQSSEGQEEGTHVPKPVMVVQATFSPSSSSGPQKSQGAAYTSAYVPAVVQPSENTREFDHLIAPILDY